MEQFTCKTCVMDKTASEIVFDGDECNFCGQAKKTRYDCAIGDQAFVGGLIFDIKTIGRGKKYDCLIGLSGGVDSSLVLHKAIELGLRPLCFSIDNGWNDPKADENIMRLVEGLKVPFFRYTINRERFLELQGAFMQAGVKNLEIPTDHILMASTYEMAAKYGIKYVLSGGNVATESIMPASWGYNARDLVHIKAIYRKFVGKKLIELPVCSLLRWNWYKWIKGIKIVYLLDYYDYNRAGAIKLLSEKYGYKDYGEKHGESVFTRWFQNFYLYEKWGIDKRKAHLSSMIVSGQVTREEALAEIAERPVYPELGIEQKVLKYPKHEYTDFPNDEALFSFISKVIRTCKRIF